MGEGQSLSDKELEAVMDDLVEDGLRPGGGSAILFEDQRCHALVQRLEVIALSLAIGPAFGLLFSEKFLGYAELWGHRVDLDIQPMF